MKNLVRKCISVLTILFVMFNMINWNVFAINAEDGATVESDSELQGIIEDSVGEGAVTDNVIDTLGDEGEETVDSDSELHDETEDILRGGSLTNNMADTLDADGEETASSYSDLISIIGSIGVSTEPVTIYITNSFSLDAPLTIPINMSITIKSKDNAQYTLSKTTNGRHFIIIGNLTLENIILDGNSSVGGVEVRGGRFVMNAEAVIQKCSIATGTGGGGVYLASGSFVMNVGAIIQNCSNYTSSGGGGVHVASGTFNMTGGTIAGNTATTTTNGGGGVYVTNGSFNMTGGIVDDNRSPRGGGIFGSSSGKIYISNSTISHNISSVAGGGIYCYFVELSGNALISNNEALLVGGGIYGAYGSNVTIKGSVEISYNSVTSLSDDELLFGGGVGMDGNSTLTMEGNSFIENCKAPNGGGVGMGSRTDSSSPTKFIMKGEAAIKACTARKNGGGVYVYYDKINQGFTFTMENGKINAKNQAVNGGGVYLNASTFNMMGGTIDGNTASINGGGVYGTAKSTITLNNGSISGNIAIGNVGDSATGNGGGIYGGDNSTITFNSGTLSLNKSIYGGGVYLNKSIFTMGEISGVDNTKAVIKDNTASYMGGGVDVHLGSKFTMNCGTIKENKSLSGDELTFGGGVEVYNGSTFIMENGIISDNSATYYSGGVEVYQNSSFTMKGGSITDNSASLGGGVSVGYQSARFTMSGGTISHNNADDNGGGVYVYSTGKILVAQGSITDNIASFGGGIFTNNTGTVEVDKCSIYNNIAHNDGGGIYTADNSYNNLKTGSETEFGTNDAYTYTEPDKALYDTKYDWIKYSAVTGEIFHPINNYDINTLFEAPIPCNITFDSQGGTGIPDQEKDFGEEVEEPDPPTRTGYEFLGWSTKPHDGNLEAEWKFDTKLDIDIHGTDLVLYAQWEVITYTVSGTVDGLISNGGVTITYSYIYTTDDGIVTEETGEVITNEEGVYSFEVPYSSIVDITPSAQTGYSVDPIIISKEIVGNSSDNDFIYTLAADFIFRKVDAKATGTSLQGAEFTLYTCTITEQDHEHDTLVTNDSTNCNWAEVDIQTSNENGLVSFTKLTLGEYMLVETKAPQGYQLPEGQWKIIVGLDDDESIYSIIAVGDIIPMAFKDVSENADEEADYQLGNIRSYSLPISGGSGIIWITISGIILTACGVVLMLIIRRNHKPSVNLTMD